MADRSFEQAYARLRSTMPDADFQSVERHGEIDKYGLPTDQKVATVVCYEPRLTNAVRKIDDWTFLVDNRFITHTVQKIAMMWLVHKGGTRFGEAELMRAMRHAFKRFYAESLVALGAPPIGRALLLESVIFERRFVEDLLIHGSEDTNPEASRFNSKSYEVAQQAIFICQRHEIGHYLLAQPGEGVVENTAKLFDGIMTPAIEYLLHEGNAALAEEAFCDAFALNSILKTPDYYEEIMPGGGFYDAMHLDEVRAASFCYTIIMQLSRVWFRAFQDARVGWDAADHGSSRPDHAGLPLDHQARERSRLVSSIADLYIRSKKGDVHARDSDFYFNPNCELLVAQAAANLDQLSEVDELASVSEPEREIARFLTSAMWASTSTSHFLIDVARQREWQGWARLDELVEPEPEAPASVDEALASPAAVRKASAASDVFCEAMQGFYSEYAKVFDAIMADIMFNAAPKEDTLDRLETFKADLCERIESFGRDDERFSSILANDYCVATRTTARRRVLETHVILLTIMRRVLLTEGDLAFPVSVQQRLSYVEGYAARNRGANVAAFTSLLIPELGTGRIGPTTLL